LIVFHCSSEASSSILATLFFAVSSGNDSTIFFCFNGNPVGFSPMNQGRLLGTLTHSLDLLEAGRPRVVSSEVIKSFFLSFLGIGFCCFTVSCIALGVGLLSGALKTLVSFFLFLTDKSKGHSFLYKALASLELIAGLCKSFLPPSTINVDTGSITAQ
jgi:hypothetical protein